MTGQRMPTKRRDEKSKAKDNLNKAIEIFKGCGADGWVKKYEEELASVTQKISFHPFHFLWLTHST